ncbi:MAG: GNAT family N-acetyltransferase [Bdellovibrionota bacterium]|nr:MAG: GNAT family N-acetyltransferase [Bdellovibrionota bacterium]
MRIETERLQLLPITEHYSQEIFREFSPEITRYMFPAPPTRIEDTLQFIQDSIVGMAANRDLQLVIRRNSNQEFLGCCGLHESESAGVGELGIWVKKSAHGHGFGMEAIRGLNSWAQNNLRYHYLVYPVDRDNIPSRRIAEALGGQVIEERTSMSLHGRVLNEVVYRIHRQEERSH